MKAFLIFALAFWSAATFGKSLRDLYFEIHSESIKEVVEKKGAAGKLDELFCRVYWLEGKTKVSVAGKVNGEIKKIVEENCLRKSKIALAVDLKEYLKPFKNVGNQGEWKVYKDDTGVNNINEVLVKKKPGYLRLIEKRPTGTTKVKYIYGKVLGQKALKKVNMSSYEGIQNVKTETLLKHKKFSGFVLPVSATMESNQNLVRKEVGDFTRSLIEKVEFKNYVVNDSKALIFFSKN